MIRNRLVFATIAAGIALTACGKNTAPQTGSISGGIAYVRIVNASPDIETVNPSAPAGSSACNFNSADPVIGPLVSVQLNGNQAVASFPYGAVSGYVAVRAAATAVSVVYPSAVPNGCPNLTFTTGTLAEGSYQTIVLEGRYAQKTLNFVQFSDVAAKGAATTFYNVSPATPSIDVGTFTPGSTNFALTATVTTGKTAPLPVAASAPGIGYYAGSGTTPIATMEPSAVDTFDASNVIPFNNESHFSIFLIDGNAATGVTVPMLSARFN